MKRTTLLVLSILAIIRCANAQTSSIKGTVIDTSEKKILNNSVIALLKKTDSTLVNFTRADKAGNFTINGLPQGTFILMITYPAYADYMDTINLKDNPSIDLGKISMTLKSQLLQEVIVSRKLGAIRIKGDTVEYKADSFYMKAGSTVEDLLKKLPGITVDKDGKITAQGETVQKVLVDGEEFFSDDPTIATRGLTADVVDRVQVFDKKSDQATFTGIDDGQKTKTIDLKLKEEKKKGFFGKLELGTDGSNYWNGNGMINAFKKKRKLSAFGIISNTGRTGLDWQENMNYGGDNPNMQMGFEDGGMFISISGNGDDLDNPGGNYYGQGVPKGWAGGINYANKWNEDKVHLNGSYQYNKLNTETEGNNQSEYILQNNHYFTNQTNNSFRSKYRNKLQGIYEWQLDSLSSLKITADGSMGHTNSYSSFQTQYVDTLGNIFTKNNRHTSSSLDAKTFNSSALYKQKFKKQGRTLSILFSQAYKENNSDGFLNSETDTLENSLYYPKELIDQQKLSSSITGTITGKITYTEPINKRSLLEFNYGVNNNHLQSSRSAFAKNGSNAKYDQLVDSLTNDYTFNVLSNTGGINYRYSKAKKITLSIGANLTKAEYTRRDIKGDSMSRYSFTNFYPQANVSFNLGQSGRLNFTYNGSTVDPNIDQIQPLKDNTDPLNVKVGNPNLKQGFRNSISMFYNNYKLLSERNVFFWLNFQETQNDFSSISTLFSDGKRYITPVNVNGNYGMNGSLYYNKKIKKWKVYTGANLRINLNHNTNYVGEFKNVNNSYTLGGGPNFNYDKEKKWSIWVQTGFSYNNSKSTISPGVVTKYWSQQHEIGLNVFLPWKMEMGTDATFMIYQKTAVFANNTNTTKWNAHIERKFLKSETARLRFEAFDILDQNIGVNRNISSNFISQTTYNTLRRYFMLSVVYNFSRNGKPMSW